MSSFGSQMRKRLKELEKIGDEFPKVVSECMESAAIAAVETAAQYTPANTGDIKGTDTRSGDMAEHWATDSRTYPVYMQGRWEAFLANNMQYASYVNDGHRVDEHYVPGLIINDEMLEMVDPSEGGIKVGTKKKDVDGMNMKEKAIGKFKSTLRKNLENEVKKLE